MDPVIRSAEKEDLPEILGLLAGTGLDDGATLLPAAEGIFERIRRYPDYRIYVARAGEEIVGTFAFLVMDNLAHMGTPLGIVEHVCVSPSWQGRGIGREMMQFAMARAREAGCYKLALSSNLKRKEAHRFYEGLGFTRHGFSYATEV